jgi:hypothetical protein
MELADADIESFRHMSIRALGNLKVSLDHDLGRQLDEDIIAIHHDCQIVVLFGRERVEIEFHTSQFGKVSLCGIEFALSMPAKQCRNWIPVDG